MQSLAIIVSSSTIILFATTAMRNCIKLAYVVSACISFYTLYLYRRVGDVLYMDAQTAEIRGRLKVRERERESSERVMMMVTTIMTSFLSQGLFRLELMILALSVLIFGLDTIYLANVWYFKASLAVFMDLKVTLFVVSLPKGSLPRSRSEPDGVRATATATSVPKKREDYRRYLENGV